jgi:hypothetical protein
VLFPEAPWLEVFRTRRGNRTEPPAVADFLAAVDQRHRTIRGAENTYQSQPIPLHVFAAVAGASPIEALFHLAARPGITVRCSGGSFEEWSNASNALGSSERVVLELSALSTLLLLGMEESLRDWPARFVVSRGTVQELRALIERRQFGTPNGRFLKIENGYAFAEQNAEVWRLQRVRFERLVIILESSCEVQGCRELAHLDSERRGNLIKAFGLHGAQSIILASNPGHVLWTDDMVLALSAKGDFGARRVWTHLVLEANADAGTIAESTYWNALFNLVGYGYSGLREHIFRRAGSLADWDVVRDQGNRREIGDF